MKMDVVLLNKTRILLSNLKKSEKSRGATGFNCSRWDLVDTWRSVYHCV